MKMVKMIKIIRKGFINFWLFNYYLIVNELYEIIFLIFVKLVSWMNMYFLLNFYESSL